MDSERACVLESLFGQPLAIVEIPLNGHSDHVAPQRGKLSAPVVGSPFRPGRGRRPVSPAGRKKAWATAPPVSPEVAVRTVRVTPPVVLKWDKKPGHESGPDILEGQGGSPEQFQEVDPVRTFTNGRGKFRAP